MSNLTPYHKIFFHDLLIGSIAFIGVVGFVSIASFVGLSLGGAIFFYLVVIISIGCLRAWYVTSHSYQGKPRARKSRRNL